VENKATLQPGKVKGLGRHCGLLASSSLLASLLFDMGKIPDGRILSHALLLHQID